MAKQTFTTGQVLTAAQMTSLQETAMGGGPATAKTASYVLVAADAGKTVAMNAAGATTITVNTGLFAAGDTVFIQNLGAGACTVTAGTATVATAGSLILPQNDAGILYFTATGVAIFYDYIQAGAVSPLTTKGDLYTFSTSDARLGVGANGTTLVADSGEATGLRWSTPASGGKVLQVVQATTATGVSIASTSYNDTGLSGTITPTLATSKILVMVTQGFGVFNSPDSGVFFMGMKLNREIASGGFSVIYTPVGTNDELVGIGSGGQQLKSVLSMQFLDNPATTSVVSYKTTAKTNSTASSQNVNFQLNSVATSTLIMLEIGA